MPNCWQGGVALGSGQPYGCLPQSCQAGPPNAGKWVLATTRSYLMVMKTTYKDPKTGKECCGFVSRMGANAPAPRLLRLKTQDVALTVGGFGAMGG
jgi:hypothetical protein